ncbi:hypothetical protein lerEdw1_019181 [Lerista edwardsae]|nr:hypothetical protein lerEdw1_019181 [Lerista edwardsae]
MPNFSFSTANNFRRFTPESLDEILKRIAEKKAKSTQVSTEGNDGQQEAEAIRPQLDLKTFKKLPALYGKPPPWLIGEPLEDVDRYYRDPFITGVVLINSVLMTLSKSPPGHTEMEYTFTAVYTAEFALKVVARGFVLHEFTYLRDPWNFLDFCVLILTYVAIACPVGRLTAFRIFRVLRTLKAVSVIPGLKVIIASLFQSVKKLFNVMLLTVFCLAVFALVSLQLFKGHLRQKCVLQLDNVTCSNNSNLGSDMHDSSRYFRMNYSSEPLLCGFSSSPNETECPENYCCMKHGDNPDNGFTSFDHFGWAFLSMFRLMTQDSWEVLYQQVIRSSGRSYSIFFVIVIFLCSFYLFNLILAVVIMAYEEQHKAALAHTKAREMLLQKAKETLKKEQELVAKRHADENMAVAPADSRKKKGRKSMWKKKSRGSKSKTYGEDETMFYSTPDKSQKELKDLLMSYQLPADIYNDAFQRQKLTSAAHVISKTMEWEESKLKTPPGLKKAVQKYLIWQCCPLWLQIKEAVKKVIIHPFTELFVTLCIIVNTLLMALEKIVVPDNYVEMGNQIFTAIFTIEAVLKIIALDPYYYFQNAWNIFDFIVVAIGLINLVIKFRLSILRMLRIFKLSKFWPALNKLMKIMLKSVGPLSNLTLVLMLTVFIFALVGKQGLEDSYKNASANCDPTPGCGLVTNASETCRLRWHMKDFLHSFLIIFRILCGEWIETMWGCMLVANHGWCVALFMLVLVVGNLVVLNLFIALLLSSFSSSTPETEEDAIDPAFQVACAHFSRGLQFVKRLLWDLCCHVPLQKLKRLSTKSKKATLAPPKVGAIELMGQNQENPVANEAFTDGEKPPLNIDQSGFKPHSSKCAPLAETESLTDGEDSLITAEVDYNKQRLELDTSGSETSTVDQAFLAYLLPASKKEPKDCFPQALVRLFPCRTVNLDTFAGSTWWRLRKTCYKIIKHTWFESFIIFLILLSSFTLTFEDIHLEERQTIKKLLDYADIFFFYVFFLEMLLKWVAYGFRKYFTNLWCLLDFFIVWVAVNALAGAAPSIGNVLLVCIVLWLPFNILGVQLFRGKLGGTVNTTDDRGKNCSWKAKSVNFDNVGIGYLALLQVATFKGWIDIMYAAVDAPDNSTSCPCFENHEYAYLYFVFFIIFGSFFMMNLFIGVVIDNFNRQRKKISGEHIFLSDEQKKYYNALKKLGTKKPHRPIPRPLNKFQQFLFDIVTKQAFDLFIISLIFLNMVVMAVEYEGQDAATENLLEKINVVFVAIFTAESAMKLLALRMYFFKDSWNIFDFIVVIFSILTSAATGLPFNLSPPVLRIIRVIRISRLLRVVRGTRGLRTLLFALLMSLPALANIGLLLFLIMFIYAIFGMSSFACAKWQDGINDLFNFQTFGSSMLCLFQITTSAGWAGLLSPMLNTTEGPCADNLHINTTTLNGPCVSRGMAIAYFVSYIIISFLVVVNMYIAVIIENFNVATEESTEPLHDDDFEIFYDVWEKFDPQATQFIAFSALSDFADSLAEPLRIPKPNKQQLIAMDLPMVHGNKIHCLDILFAFTKRVLGESGEMGSLESQIEEKYPEKIAFEPIVTTPRRKQDESAIVIQRAFRRHRLQRTIMEAPLASCENNPLENIPEEESVPAVQLEDYEDSQSGGSPSPSSLRIPPSYSNITGANDDILQVTITDCDSDAK